MLNTSVLENPSTCERGVTQTQYVDLELKKPFPASPGMLAELTNGTTSLFSKEAHAAPRVFLFYFYLMYLYRLIDVLAAELTLVAQQRFAGNVVPPHPVQRQRHVNGLPEVSRHDLSEPEGEKRP